MSNKYLPTDEQISKLPTVEQMVDAKKQLQPVSASDVARDEIRYLWRPYILRGDVTIVGAAGGTGKTFALCGLVAEISKGRLPLNPFETFDPMRTLFISAEDPAFVLRDRFEKAGADLNQIDILDAEKSAVLTLSDGQGRPEMMDLENMIKRCKPDLVVIDPLHAFIGSDVKMTDQNAIRPFMQDLANLAKRYNCAIVDVAHVSKRSAGANANDAIMGSTDIVNASRSALRVIFDETGANQNRRVIVHTKSNYSAYGQSVSFEIDDDGSLKWTGYSEVTREDLETAARRNVSVSELLSNREASRRSTAFVADQIEALAKLQTEKKRFYSFRELTEHGIKNKAEIAPSIGELSRRGIVIVFPTNGRWNKDLNRVERGIEIVKP